MSGKVVGKRRLVMVFAAMIAVGALVLLAVQKGLLPNPWALGGR